MEVLEKAADSYLSMIFEECGTLIIIWRVLNNLMMLSKTNR